MSATSLPCYPDGERVPGHKPQHVSADLFDAMGKLYAELSALEIDTANAHGNPRLAAVVEKWERQHEKLGQFFDLDVYLDREPVQEAA